MDEQKTKEENKKESMNTTLEIEENVEGALAYLIPFLSGIFFFLAEKKSKFVRYHAFQSILFSIVILVIYIGVEIIFTPFYMFIPLIMLYNIVIQLLDLGILLAILFLMYKAYNKEWYKIPKLGKIAEREINK